MILRGSFSTLSIAVYGQLAASNSNVEAPTLHPSQRLPEIQRQSLPSSIDVVRMSDPASLARQLVASANNASASLEIALRCYCGVSQETAPAISEELTEAPASPLPPPIPELFPDDDEGHVVHGAIQLIKYFEEVVCSFGP